MTASSAKESEDGTLFYEALCPEKNIIVRVKVLELEFNSSGQPTGIIPCFFCGIDCFPSVTAENPSPEAGKKTPIRLSPLHVDRI